MFKQVLILLMALVFCTCKKYDEGGALANAKKHLLAHGGKWYVESFEVTVDSADVITKLYPNFESERNLTINCVKDLPNNLFIKNTRYFDSYSLVLKDYNKSIDVTLIDRCPCPSAGCYSYLFTPNVKIVKETINSGYSTIYRMITWPTVNWKIKKLTKTVVILTSTIGTKNHLIKLIAN